MAVSKEAAIVTWPLNVLIRSATKRMIEATCEICEQLLCYGKGIQVSMARCFTFSFHQEQSFGVRGVRVLTPIAMSVYSPHTM